MRGLLLGISGFRDAATITIPLTFTPLNAAFVAGLYLAGTISLVLTLFSRDRADARPFLLGTAVVTTLLLAVTGAHWTEFNTMLSTPLVLWVGSYVFDPIAITLLVVTHRMGAASQPGAHARSWLFIVEAAVLGMLGWFMLALPEAAAVVWPWRIPPLVAQLYSCFFLAFATIALLVAYERRPALIRTFTISSLALLGLMLLASLLYRGRFGDGASTWLWFGGLFVGIGAFALALVRDAVVSWQPAATSA